MNMLKSIREIFKTIKFRKPAKKYCPRCGSPRIHLSSSLDYGITPKKYVCENCGYRGPLVMEIEKEDRG